MLSARVGFLKNAVVAAFVSLVLSFGLIGCSYQPSSKQAQGIQPSSAQGASSSATSGYQAPERKTYADFPTAYPELYSYNPESAWKVVYNESRVISYTEAANYVGQAVTVEGGIDSVVYASSSNGTPVFFNIGGGAYEPGGFAVVIWGQDFSRFDTYSLRNFVEWSMSDQPITVTLRVSGVVEMYNDRPQIVARDGSQVSTCLDDGTWASFMSESAVDALMEAIYH